MSIHCQRHAPYIDLKGQAVMETISPLASFAKTSVVFIDDGVYQLVANQQPDP